MKKINIKNKIVLTISLVFLFYIAIILFSDISKISEEIFQIDPITIIIILAIEIISLIIRSIRQWKLFDTIGIKLKFTENLKLYFAGMSMFATPGGAGILIKSQYLKNKFDIPRSKSSPAMLIERYQDFLALTVILLITLIISFLWISLILTSISIVMLSVGFIIFRKITILDKIRLLCSNNNFLLKFIPKIEFDGNLKNLTNIRVTIICCVLGIASFLVEGIGIFLSFNAFEQNMSYIHVLQLFYTSIILGALSFLPGGLGITEGSMINLLVSDNTSLATATTLVLFIRLSTIWFATFVGFLFARIFLKTN